MWLSWPWLALVFGEGDGIPPRSQFLYLFLRGILYGFYHGFITIFHHHWKEEYSWNFFIFTSKSRKSRKYEDSFISHHDGIWKAPRKHGKTMVPWDPRGCTSLGYFKRLKMLKLEFPSFDFALWQIMKLVTPFSTIWSSSQCFCFGGRVLRDLVVRHEKVISIFVGFPCLNLDKFCSGLRLNQRYQQLHQLQWADQDRKQVINRTSRNFTSGDYF